VAAPDLLLQFVDVLLEIAQSHDVGRAVHRCRCSGASAGACCGRCRGCCRSGSRWSRGRCRSDRRWSCRSGWRRGSRSRNGRGGRDLCARSGRRCNGFAFVGTARRRRLSAGDGSYRDKSRERGEQKGFAKAHQYPLQLEDRRGSSVLPGHQETGERLEPQAPAGHLPLMQPSRQVGFSPLSSGSYNSGGNHPRDRNRPESRSRSARSTLWRDATERRARAPIPKPPHGAGPMFGLEPAPQSGRARSTRENCCVLQKTAAERYGSGTGTDRRSNAALGRNGRATAQASDGGLIPSNERAAVRRRE
jgi:hypothetical protein